jgi:hypothetical protein
LSTNAQLTQQINNLLAAWNQREAQFRDWLAGTPTGGPNGDGRYPLSDASGVTQLVDCPAKLADTVGGPAGLSTTARLLAETARDVAITARDRAIVAETQVISLHGETISNRDLAKMYRDDAAAFASNAGVARTGAETALTGASAAKVAAEAARDLTEDYRDETLLARDASVSARNEAQTARNEAQSFAASINPANFAPASHTHTIAQITGLQSALDAKLNTSGFTWAALPGKPSTFTPSAHSHVIADVTGLQAALDAKLNTSGFTWAALSGKPSTFTPSAHSHVVADVTGLQSLLDNRMLRGVDQWLTSTDGRSRFFFANNGRSFFGSPNGYEWRNASDQNIMEVWNGGEVFFKGNGLWLEGPSPTMWWRDSNHRAFGIHVNDDLAYFMRGGTNDPSWSALSNGQWPVVLNLNNGDVTFGRNIGVTENVFAPSLWLGDDVVLGDVNVANTVCVRGQQNGDRGYIQFGIGSASQLGAVAGGALTYNGSTVWHAGNFDPSTRAPLVHGHSINDVSGLQTALDARVPWSEYTGSGRQSLTSNGYQRLPGGLILQWGSVFIAGNGSATVTYPISFPNAAFIVLADGGETVTNRQDNGPAVTSFNAFTASITNGIDVGISTRWFAIGW